MKIRTLLGGTILAVVLGLAGWLGWRWYTTPVVPEIPLEGVEKLMVDAVEEARQKVRLQPRSGAAWGELAMVLAGNGFSEYSFFCFAQAERLEPKNPSWPYLHGVRLLADKPEQALSLLRRALTLSRSREDQAVILFRLATVLIENGHLDEAEQHLGTMRRIDAPKTFVLYGHGLLAKARDDPVSAREHLAQLTNDPFAGKKACTLLASLPGGDKDLVRTYLERIASPPDDLPWPDPFEEDLDQYKVDRAARVTRILVMDRQGKHQEALDLLRRYVDETPDEMVCFTFGAILSHLQQFEKAVPALRQALEFNPKNVQSHLYLGEALVGLAEKRQQEPGGQSLARELFQEAVKAAEEALALARRSGIQVGAAHLVRGRALLHLGRTDEGLQALRDALLCQPESSETHLALGEALANQAQMDEALKHLQEAVRLAAPDDPQPKAALVKWRARFKTP